MFMYMDVRIWSKNENRFTLTQHYCSIADTSMNDSLRTNKICYAYTVDSLKVGIIVAQIFQFLENCDFGENFQKVRTFLWPSENFLSSKKFKILEFDLKSEKFSVKYFPKTGVFQIFLGFFLAKLEITLNIECFPIFGKFPVK